MKNLIAIDKSIHDLGNSLGVIQSLFNKLARDLPGEDPRTKRLSARIKRSIQEHTDLKNQSNKLKGR